MTTNYNSDNICIDNIDKLLTYFELSYSRTKTRITMSCPVHGGDNPGACTIFLDSPPNWKCWTHHCENQGTSIFSFFRFLLQKKLDRKISNNQFRLWLEKRYGSSPITKNINIEQYDIFSPEKDNYIGIETI